MLGMGKMGITAGGWMQLGYHSDVTRGSVAPNDNLSFNDVPDALNLQQAWMWMEKKADGRCGCDIGFRIDMMYGTDAQKTQAFGDPSAANNGRGFGSWDASFDNGRYGWAIPQMYVELAAGDFSIIAGHFFTIVGYEVVGAPNNFFYSHALTMFNAEPFTHTGALMTYSGIDDVTLYAGWTLGWDSGFKQYHDNGTAGSSFLGGFGLNLTDDVTFTYITTFGDFGARSNLRTYTGAANAANVHDRSAYSHSMVLDVTLSDKLNYVLQSDMVAVRNGVGHDQIGVNQYLFYELNDTVSAGSRLEWFKSDSVSFYEVTAGLNIKLADNIVIRPEYRYDWSPTSPSALPPAGTNYNQSTFGIDGYITF